MENFGDTMVAMPILKPKHLKALAKKNLGLFISNNVYKNAKCLVLKKIKQQFIKDFKVLNNYTLELKYTNPESNVIVLSERQIPKT